MFSQILLLFLLSFDVRSDDIRSLVRLDSLTPVLERPRSRSDRYVDVYTNHGDFQDVVNSYYGIPRRLNHRRFERLPEIVHDISVFKNAPPVEKISPLELENSHLDRIDFDYPKTGTDFFHENHELESPFGSFTNEHNSEENNKYMFMQSQKLFTNEQKPQVIYKRKIPKHNQMNYIQKIPKVTTPMYETKYEQIEISNYSNSTDTKNRINRLLKDYLSKLYEKKYNNTVSNTERLRLEEEEKKKTFLNYNSLHKLKNKAVDKINKFFSLFTVVKFNNTRCTASNAAGEYEGVCYTASQCSSEGGTALDNCASGYGVCCVFLGSCGDSGSQNCTYFQSPNYPDYYPSDGGVVVPTTPSPTTDNPSPTPDPRFPWNFGRTGFARQSEGALSCTFNVSKLNDGITRMRIDFEDLELTGPTNGTCMDERLVIMGQNTNSQIPTICGYNTGQHVYVDVSSLPGPLQISVLSATGARKRFKIKICQFSDTCLEPSSNCLQYYTGITGVISSFNYDQASMLSRSVPGYFNNLNYAICIRREEGYCSITYRNVVNGVEYPFQLTNVDDSGNLIMPGQAGADVLNCPDDYIVIDGTRLCGDKFNDGSENNDYTMNADVTDTGAGPIVIPVRTDAALTGMGFKLFYTQNPCAGY